MSDEPNRPDKPHGPYFRGAAILSAPTILITYPLVGFGLGYFLVKMWHWPIWTMLVTLIMGLIQGMREVYKLSKQIENDEDK